LPGHGDLSVLSPAIDPVWSPKLGWACAPCLPGGLWARLMICKEG
jgi:hypothetical protein